MLFSCWGPVQNRTVQLGQVMMQIAWPLFKPGAETALKDLQSQITQQQRPAPQRPAPSLVLDSEKASLRLEMLRDPQRGESLLAILDELPSPRRLARNNVITSATFTLYSAPNRAVERPKWNRWYDQCEDRQLGHEGFWELFHPAKAPLMFARCSTLHVSCKPVDCWIAKLPWVMMCSGIDLQTLVLYQLSVPCCPFNYDHTL